MVLPVAGAPRPCMVAAGSPFAIMNEYSYLFFVGACIVLCLAGKSFVSLWWCIAVYERSQIFQYGTSDKGGVYSI